MMKKVSLSQDRPRSLRLIVALSAAALFLGNANLYAADPEPPNDNSPATELTLESCIRIAIESATEVLKAKNDLALKAVQVMKSYGQFQPTLSTIIGASAQDGRYFNTVVTPALVSTQNWGPSAQITSSINIFNGNGDIASLNAALEKKNAGSLTLERVRQQIALDVAQSFLRAAYDQRLLDISIENLKVSRARQELLEAQAKIGLKDMADFLRQQAIASRDEATLNRIYASEKEDLLALLVRLRLDTREQYKIVPPKILKPKDGEAIPLEDDLIKLALQNRPDLKSSEHALIASKFDVKAANAGFLPRLDFSLSAFDAGRLFVTNALSNGVNEVPANQRSFGEQLGSQIIYSLGLTMTWNIFDRDQTKAAVQASRIAARNSQIDVEDATNLIVADVRRVYAEYQSALGQFKANQDGLNAAEKAYQVIKGKYDVGVAKFLDLADAQATLVQAQSDEAQSLYQVELQRRALATVTGETEPPNR